MTLLIFYDVNRKDSVMVQKVAVICTLFNNSKVFMILMKILLVRSTLLDLCMMVCLLLSSF